ncbi:MAG TPA: tetratricopeptide repeat protein [Xanthomonadales bacterium]|nr:tetratricopeptide repeat protein [Xanthomonadales bacterium]
MLEEILELHRQGRLDDAESRYRELLTFNPDDPETLHLLAILRRQRNDLREAVQLVRRAIELNPERANYYVTLGGLELHGRQLDAARADFETAVRLNPNLAAAHAALGQIALLQGDGERAEDNFKRALKSDERPDALTGYGNLLLQRGDTDGALRYLTRAADLTPADPAVQAALGRAYLSKGMHAFAEAALGNALRIKPNYQAARMVLAEALLAQKRFDDARPELEALIRDPDTHPVALTLLGDAARARGDLRAAAGHYTDSLKLRDRQPRVIAALAWTLAQMRQLREAIGAYRRLLELEPNDLEARKALGLTSLDAGLNDDAETALRAVLAARPDDGEARAALAASLEARGRFEEANATAGQVLARDERNVVAALVAARGALRGGDAAAAAARLDALAGAKTNAVQQRFAARLRGVAADALGDVDGAVAQWRIAQGDASRAPELPDVPRNLDAHVEAARTRGAVGAERAPNALLLGLPGSGVELAARLVASLPNVALLGDRFGGGGARSDGLAEGHNRYLDLDDDQAHVQARRYARGLERLGIAPDAVVVDWLPLFDAHFLPLLHRLFGDTRLVVVTRDPRETLLDWLALGSASGFNAVPEAAAARWLARAHAHLEAARTQSALPVLEIAAGALRDDPAGTRARIAAFLGTDAGDAPMPPLSAGLPAMLPADRVARYGDALADAFAALRA